MKRKFFFKKFFQYFRIFSLPVIIIGLILSIFSFIKIREDIYLQSQSTFQIGTELIEEVVTQGDDLAAIFNNSATVSLPLYKILNEHSLNYKEYVAKELISSILDNSANNSDFIDSIYVYLKNNRGMFFQTGRNVQSMEDTLDNQWLLLFDSRPQNSDTWIVKRSFSNYNFEAPHESVSIFHKLKYFDGVLVTNLNIQNLTQRLSTIENYPNEIILVANPQNQVLFSNKSSLSISETFMQEIMEQFDSLFRNKTPYLSTIILNHQNYIVTSFTSNKYDLHFLSLVPQRDIYQLLYQIIYCVIFGVIFAAILCLFFSFYLTNRSFTQISNLMDILWHAEQGDYPSEESFSDDLKHLDEYSLILNQIILTYVRNNVLTLKVQESELKKTVSELKALQLQINPHFFFNTLQSIDMEVIKKEGYLAPASKLIHALSDILSYALEDSSAPTTLREEIKSSRQYFEIQQFHYPGQLTLLWDYDEDILDYSVIRLLFQPFLENSIRYSILSPNDHCLIRIKIQDRGDSLRFYILDTGYGMDFESLEQLRASLNEESAIPLHIGVKNTHKRLVLTYPGTEGLSIVSVLGKGTCIRFSIPKQKP